MTTPMVPEPAPSPAPVTTPYYPSTDPYSYERTREYDPYRDEPEITEGPAQEETPEERQLREQTELELEKRGIKRRKEAGKTPLERWKEQQVKKAAEKAESKERKAERVAAISSAVKAGAPRKYLARVASPAVAPLNLKAPVAPIRKREIRADDEEYLEKLDESALDIFLRGGLQEEEPRELLGGLSGEGMFEDPLGGDLLSGLLGLSIGDGRGEIRAEEITEKIAYPGGLIITHTLQDGRGRWGYRINWGGETIDWWPGEEEEL